MEAIVAYPNEYLDNIKLNDYYQNLAINSEKNYLRDQLSINLFNRANKYENLRKPYIRSNWINFEWSKTAGYQWESNIMGKVFLLLKIFKHIFRYL